jgi:hypothetical protein
MTKTDPGFTVAVQRPVKASLYVKTEHGEEWLATEEDLDRFRLVQRSVAYAHLISSLESAGMDPSDRHSSLRYLIERSVYSGQPLDPNDDDPNDDSDAGYIARLRRSFAAWTIEGDEI